MGLFPGGPVVYNFVISASAQVNGIGFNDTAPTGVVFDQNGITATGSSGTTSVSSDGSMAMGFGFDLNAGGMITVTITGRIDPTVVCPGTFIANTVLVNSNFPTSNPASNTPDPISCFTKTTNPPTTVMHGDTVTYSILISNNTGTGPTPVTMNLNFSDTAPAGLEFISAVGSPNAVIQTSGSVTGSFSLPAGGTQTINITANVLPSALCGAISNSAILTLNDLEGQVPNNTVTQTSDVQVVCSRLLYLCQI